MNGLLSHDETLALLARVKAGDAAAEERLILANTALVKSIVRRFLSRGAEYDDLMQIGTIGLMKAIKGFDDSFGVRFSTYAVPMIAGELKRYLRDDGMIKVSRGLKETAIRIFRVQEELKRTLGRDAELSELAEKSGLSEEAIVEALEASRAPVSIYEPVYRDGEALLLDTIVAPDEQKLLLDKLLLSQLLERLEERERRIILLRFFRDKTQSEIAAEIGVSQVQVSRLIGKILEKLKTMAEDKI